MIGYVFHRIYCMNPVLLILLFAGLTMAFAFVYHKNQNRRYCQPVIGLLLLIAVAAIFAVTLLNRTEHAEGLTPSLLPFASYRYVMEGGSIERLRSNFMNVVLFYPAGLFAAVLLPQRWNPVLRVLLVSLAFAFISAGIEYAQYVFVLGQPEADDVIHNTLGALIGGICGGCIIKYQFLSITCGFKK